MVARSGLDCADEDHVLKIFSDLLAVCLTLEELGEIYPEIPKQKEIHK